MSGFFQRLRYGKQYGYEVLFKNQSKTCDRQSRCDRCQMVLPGWL